MLLACISLYHGKVQEEFTCERSVQVMCGATLVWLKLAYSILSFDFKLVVTISFNVIELSSI